MDLHVNRRVMSQIDPPDTRQNIPFREACARIPPRPGHARRSGPELFAPPL